jgi:hypothetical protein
MRYALCAPLAIGLCLTAADARSQTSVIQQSVTVNHESSSVTVSGGTISVETAAGSGGRVVGNGQPGSEARPIGLVTAIATEGAFALTIKTGPTPQLTIAADKNILPIVKTEISNGRLEIFTDRSYSLDGRIKITLSSPNVGEISASGSNRINAEGLAGSMLSVSLNGSNRADLAGEVSALTCRMSGSNQLTANRLTADSATVTVSGSGSASVNARQRVAAEISGAGSITVYGNPKERSTQVNGSGKITFVE